MIHPLLRLIATRPQLLADHAEAYAGLASVEFGRALGGWQRRLLLQAVAVCLGGTALAMAGVAWMLWAVTPDSQLRAVWVLWTVPGGSAVLALACLIIGRQQGAETFVALRQQAAADLQLLREAGGT
jgi:hypothetical protein